MEELLSSVVEPSKQRGSQLLPESPAKRKTMSWVESPAKRQTMSWVESPAKRNGNGLGFESKPFYWNDYSENVVVLGKGRYGKVYGLTDKRTGQKYALKLILLSDKQGRIEANIMTRLSEQCPMLVRYYNSLITNDPMDLNPDQMFFGLLMEWVQGPNLREEIRNKNLPNMAQFLSTTRDLLSQLACVHASDIVHRDIKPENIVFDTANMHAKLIDFGIGCSTGQPNHIPICDLKNAGTLGYMAPETILSRNAIVPTLPASPASDIWSLGATLYEWLFGEKVVQSSFGLANQKRIEAIQEKSYVPDFLKSMLQMDAERRPSAQQLLLSLQK